jgi:hypothetical protein
MPRIRQRLLSKPFTVANLVLLLGDSTAESCLFVLHRHETPPLRLIGGLKKQEMCEGTLTQHVCSGKVAAVARVGVSRNPRSLQHVKNSLPP